MGRYLLIALLLLAAACGDAAEPPATSAPPPTATTAPPPTATTATPPAVSSTTQVAVTTTAPAATTTVPTTTTTSTTGGATEIAVVVSGGSVEVSGPGEVSSGDDVRLVVTADVADEVHLHGYDLTVDAEPGVPAVLEFTADIPGIFEVELEQARLELLELVVNP